MYAIDNECSLQDNSAAEAATACGRWVESSAALRRGLEVIEHEWPQDGADLDLLMELVSFA
jgi:hypothetical protein